MQDKNIYSRIISGTMTWGAWGKNFNQNEMIDFMRFSLEQGITTFDHADIYGGYGTESDFGDSFSKNKIERDKVQFITKCGIQMVDDSRENVVKH